ncbi:MAG: beta-hydroxyacyl-ACP dehydratase [Elusimicrobia bacterium]|nr:beta-hydroxyacyl-ACP dehydratase [Elusimicrobiota bacterium]
MNDLTPAEVLALVPQQRPMRFIDEILELDQEHILAVYTWKDEDCAGHFPGNPVVPGVKLIEMSAQVGNVAWGIYHMALKTSPEEIGLMVGFFTEIERGVFKKMVRPGDKVAAYAHFGPDGYFRGNKMASRVEIQFSGGPKDGEEIFSARTSGLWVPRDSPALK